MEMLVRFGSVRLGLMIRSGKEKCEVLQVRKLPLV